MVIYLHPHQTTKSVKEGKKLKWTNIRKKYKGILEYYLIYIYIYIYIYSKRGYYGWIAPTTSREQPTGKYSNLAFNLYGLSDVKELERNHGNSEESEINVPKEDDPMTNESRKEQKGKKWSNVNKMTNQSRKEKTRWSKEEDERLKNALEKYKHYIQKPWELIADDVKTRKPDQCKSRNQKINKAIEKGKMSNEDYSHDDYIKDKTKKEIEIIQNDKKM